jgi:signal transduction histidine kinase
MRILPKLLIAYATPTLLLFALFAFFAYDLQRRDLDAALGTRLAAVAAQAAARVRGQYLLDMDPEEQPLPVAYAYTRKQLVDAARAAGVERMYIFAPDHRSLCDTRPDLPIGHVYNELELDREEIARALAGAATASVLFRGRDGRLHKAGYAPVTRGERDDTVVAALRVEAPAAYFQELAGLARRLVSYGAILAAAVVAVSFVVAALLTRPLRRLAGSAEAMGRGQLEAPVPHSGSDEIAQLARTLDEMREGLRARDQRLHMMLAGIAHEVRNPLGGIRLYAGILRDELAAAGAPEQLGHVQRIEKELSHLEAVVSEFLEFARRPPLRLERVDAGALVAEVGELVRADAERAGVDLEVRAPDAPLPVRADAHQLRRALLNLARNALQATAAGGTVTLAATAGAAAPAPGAGAVVIEVTDTGRGVPADELERIFAPFYTTKEKGTGLGLAFVKEIVGDHQGKLRVASRIGAGTTFTIEIQPWA